MTMTLIDPGLYASKFPSRTRHHDCKVDMGKMLFHCLETGVEQMRSPIFAVLDHEDPARANAFFRKARSRERKQDKPVIVRITEIIRLSPPSEIDFPLPVA